MNIEHISIIGLGGVGGYFGFKLAQYAQQNTCQVTFVARGETFDIIREQGFTLLSPEVENSTIFPDTLVKTPQDITQADLILICVKEYDLKAVCEALLPVVNSQTILLPLINGVDIYDRIRAVIPNGIVLPSCIYIASHKKSKAVVEHKGIAGRFLFGADALHPQANFTPLEALFEAANIDGKKSDNVALAIWTKFTFVASFAIVMSKYNEPLGRVYEDEIQRNLAIQIIEEIAQVAQAKGVNLPEDIAEQTIAKAKTFPYNTPTSLQLDVQNRRSHNELDIFAGTIIKYGKKFSIPTPTTQALYDDIVAFLGN